MIVWLASLALALECSKPVAPSELDAAFDRTEKAWIDLDDTAFRDTMNEVGGLLLPCAAQVVTADEAARWHRLVALQLFSIGDPEGAAAAIEAAHAAKPDLAWDDALLPANHELRAHWASLTEAPRTHNVPEPRGGSIAFDGKVGRARPSDVPSIVQLVDAVGAPHTTVYLGPGEALPVYPAIPRQRNILLGCATGAGVTGALTYGMAWGAHGKLYSEAANPDTSADDLDALQTRTNRLSALSTTLLGVGIGCGIGAVVIGPR